MDSHCCWPRAVIFGISGRRVEDNIVFSTNDADSRASLRRPFSVEPSGWYHEVDVSASYVLPVGRRLPCVLFVLFFVDCMRL